MEARRFVEGEGRRSAWREVGDGPPLLLLQGFSGTADDWDPTFLDALASTFRVVAPDPRGMGASTWGDPDEPLSVASMAADALAVLDAAVGSQAQAVVAGWSMGGFVAQAVVGAAPARVRGLALVATDPGGPGAVQADPAVWARLVDLTGTPRQQATRLLHLLFPALLAEQFDTQVGEVVADARAALDPVAVVAQDAAIGAWHEAAVPVLVGPTPPTVAVAGSLDLVIPPANLEGLAVRWRGCRTELVEGAGHAVMAQAPERVAGLIRSLA